MAPLFVGSLMIPRASVAQPESDSVAKADRPGAVVLNYRTRRGEPLTMIVPGDPQFDAEMEAHFPRYLDAPDYESERPFLILLRNDTQRTVRAYEVIWHVQEPDTQAPEGVRQRNLRTFAITTPLELRAPAGIRGADKSIPPGGERVVSPLFNGAPSDFERFAFLSAAQKLPQPGTYATISPELDCAVYGDGSYAGPNHSQLLLRYNVARDAQHDEALSVLRMLRAKPDDPQLRNALTARRQIAANDTRPNDKPIPLYIHARSIAAQEFEEVLDAGGYSRVYEIANELVNLMPPHEAFTQLGGAYHASTFHVDGQVVSPLD